MFQYSICSSNSEILNDKLFEGDIKTDYEHIKQAYGVETADIIDESLHLRHEPKLLKGLTNKDAYLWKEKDDDGNIIIPYEFKYYSSNSFSSWKSKVESTLQKFEESFSDKYAKTFKFIKRSTGKRIKFSFDYSGCWAYIGAPSSSNGVTGVNIQTPGCDSNGVIAHEVSHALGVWHEQSRPDRDNYVTIVDENIVSGMSHNFQKRSDIDSLDVEYDYGSVMHYGANYFSNGNGNTIISPVSIGQRTWLSEKDIEGLARLYKLGDDWTPSPTKKPTKALPTPNPTKFPTSFPTKNPTKNPVTGQPTYTAPSGWYCRPNRYGTNDGCDCNCGIPDPDCSPYQMDAFRCSDFEMCNPNGECSFNCSEFNNDKKSCKENGCKYKKKNGKCMNKNNRLL